MSTKLLEETAVRMMEDDGLFYTRADDDELRLTLPTDDAMVAIRIFDHEVDPPALSIKMSDFVRFPEERRDCAIRMCNAFSRRGFGKFTVDDYGDVSYELDFPIAEDAGPDGFRQALILAMSWFAKMYPMIMRVRWAGASVEDELERPKESENRGGSALMTDADIGRLMGESDPDEDGE